MPEPLPPADLSAKPTPPAQQGAQGSPLRLALRLAAGDEPMVFEWRDVASGNLVARGEVSFGGGPFRFFPGRWTLTVRGQTAEDQSTLHMSSIRAALRRWRGHLPATETTITAVAADGAPLAPPRDLDPWLWIARQVAAHLVNCDARFEGRVRAAPRPDDPPEVIEARESARLLRGAAAPEPRVVITLDFVGGHIRVETAPGRNLGPGQLRSAKVEMTAQDELTWILDWGRGPEPARTRTNRNAIRGRLRALEGAIDATPEEIAAQAIRPAAGRKSGPPEVVRYEAWPPDLSPWDWLENEVARMVDNLRINFSPLARAMEDMDPLMRDVLERDARRAEKESRRQAELEARIEEGARRLRQREREREQERRQREAERQRRESQAQRPQPPATPERPPPPSVPVRLELAPLEVQETLVPLADLRGWFLREQAARWWISNQSDDLLCLPFCRIERLDYQLRTALRVLGPLRGRALLSDEVGLGKTIEAGLVLKELLTRGLVKRFLVLTVPSLVDQWEEELADKFDLTVTTTNHAAFRANPEACWRDGAAVVASLHTLKQPAHLAVARGVTWDLLVVDEAHYLRNRDSQAWQAVNALPRQFLLLLTATPVQNSLEELYNLVTLLQPGQLPTPREFRARFVDPKRPHQPREPEELRRLLGQVMIRNTRANAGLKLPPRRAETVMFTPDDAERAFWEAWETELRAALGRLSASQATLWGRLLLQAAGSSPAAWRDALTSFPVPEAAADWPRRAPLEAGWERKCASLPALAKGDGGVVIFTQFLRTQAALADWLRRAGVTVFAINGQTPAPERQPITEQFHQQGGALLLTHSGTEGRNLQFCHRLVNFDLPWNPMEIEQRIGRLHRLGQRNPVRIYNLVQAGTLQEHLLQVLQDKLNLFELVVGETGLILGDRFSSDEFAEEVLRRWRESEGRVAEAMRGLGEELAAARAGYAEVKQLDETLFAKDYESL